MKIMTQNKNLHTYHESKSIWIINRIMILCIPFTIFFILSTAVQAENDTVSDALPENERIVTSYEELRDALTINNGVTTVYFGADITMKAGINIHSNKANVIISGINPQNPNQSEPYTLTDYSSASFTDTIYISASGIQSLLVSDLNITGKNYYGSFSVLESSATDNLVVTYQRVAYNGPQIGHHRRGKLHFIDCTIKIHGNNGGSPNQEFSEARYLIFEGNNTIETTTGTTSVFWHPGGGAFEVADDSSLTLTALQVGSLYGVYYADAGNINLTIGKRAAFYMKTCSSVNFYSQAVLSSITVNENGVFDLETTKDATAAVMSLGGNLNVDKNAIFRMNGYGGSSFYLLSQRTGDITISQGATFHLVTGGTYAALLRLYGRSLICNDPASVLLYNTAGRDILATDTVGELHINAEQINYRTAAGTGGFDDPPLYHWKKSDGSNFIMDAVLATGTNGNLSSLSSNFAENDSPGIAPSLTTLSMTSARVLSFGRLEPTIHAPLNELSSAITGTSSPGAAIRASSAQDSIDHILPDTEADSNGFFSVLVDVPMSEGTLVIVRSTFQYLTGTASAFVSPAGKIEMTIPEKMIFEPIEISTETQIARRADADWSFVVTDTRTAGSGWKIFARAPTPLTLSSSSRYILEDALVFIDKAGTVTPLQATDFLLVYEDTSSTEDDITRIQWEAGKGLLLRIPPDNIHTGSFIAKIEWILADTP